MTDKHNDVSHEREVYGVFHVDGYRSQNYPWVWPTRELAEAAIGTNLPPHLKQQHRTRYVVRPIKEPVNKHWSIEWEEWSARHPGQDRRTCFGAGHMIGAASRNPDILVLEARIDELEAQLRDAQWELRTLHG